VLLPLAASKRSLASTCPGSISAEIPPA